MPKITLPSQEDSTSNTPKNTTPSTGIKLSLPTQEEVQGDAAGAFGKGTTSSVNPNDYHFQLKNDINNDYLREDRQSALDQLGNAGANLIGKTAAYLGQTAGFLGGALTVPFEGISGMTDNWAVKASDELKDYVSKEFPIYKSRGYDEASMFGKLAHTGWWLDDGIDRLALTVATLAPGMLAERGISLAGGLAKVLEARGATSLADGMKVMAAAGKMGTLDAAVDKAAISWAKNLTRGEMIAQGVITQPALSGRESQVAVKNYLKEHQSENGLSDEEIETKSAEAAVATFKANIPLTLLNMVVEFPQLYRSFKGTSKLLEDAFETTAGKVGKKALPEEASLLSKVGTTIGKAALTGLEHGQNERYQVAIGNYFEKLYEGKSDEENLPSTIQSITKDWWSSDDKNMGANTVLGTVQGVITSLAGVAMHQYRLANGEKTTREQIQDLHSLYDSHLHLLQGLTDGFLAKNPDGSTKVDGVKPRIDGVKAAISASKESQVKLNQMLNEAGQTLEGPSGQMLVDLSNHNTIESLAYEWLNKPGGAKALTDMIKAQHEQLLSTEGTEKEVLDKTTGKKITVEQHLNNMLETVKRLERINTRIQNANIKVNTDKLSDEEKAQVGNSIAQTKAVLFGLGSKMTFWQTQSEKLSKALSEAESSELPADKDTIDKLKKLYESSQEELKLVKDSYTKVLNPENIISAVKQVTKRVKELTPTYTKLKDIEDKQKSLEEQKAKDAQTIEDKYSKDTTLNPEAKAEELKQIEDKHAEALKELEKQKKTIVKEATKKAEKSKEESTKAPKIEVSDSTNDNPADLYKNHSLELIDSDEELFTGEYDPEKPSTILSTRRKRNEFTTASGLDDGQSVSRNRFFRTVESLSSPTENNKLLVVHESSEDTLVKKLMAEILADYTPEELAAKQKADKEKPDVKGIWLVITDKEGTPIKGAADGKIVWSTIPSVENVGSINGSIVMSDSKRLPRKEAYVKFKRACTAEKGKYYLPIVKRSAGIPNDGEAVEGKIPRFSVIGSLVKSFNQLFYPNRFNLVLPATGVNGLARITDDVFGKVGTLYAVIKNEKVMPLQARFVNSAEAAFIAKRLVSALQSPNGLTEADKEDIEKFIMLGTNKKGYKAHTISYLEDSIVLGTDVGNVIHKSDVTEESREELESRISQWLQENKLVSAKSKHMNSQAFVNPITGKSTTYTEFLVAGESPLFTTKVMPNDAGEPSVVQQYLHFAPEPPYEKLDTETFSAKQALAKSASNSKTALVEDVSEVEALAEDGVHVIRHGDVDFNNQGLARGTTNLTPTINEEGRKDAEKLHKQFAKVLTTPASVFCSYLSRAKDTLKIIFPNLDVESTTKKADFSTWDIGKLEGTDSKALKKLQEEVVRDPSRWDERIGETGESFNTFKNRIIKSFKIAIQAPGAVVIQTHSQVQNLIKASNLKNFNLDIEQFLQPTENTGSFDSYRKSALAYNPEVAESTKDTTPSALPAEVESVIDNFDPKTISADAKQFGTKPSDVKQAFAVLKDKLKALVKNPSRKQATLDSISTMFEDFAEFDAFPIASKEVILSYVRNFGKVVEKPSVKEEVKPTEPTKKEVIKEVKEGNTPATIAIAPELSSDSMADEAPKVEAKPKAPLSPEEKAKLLASAFKASLEDAALEDDEDLNRRAKDVVDASLITQEERDWFEANMPSDIPVELVKGLIDSQSFGRFLASGKILLSDIAARGTLYHEAFHAVTQMYLKPEERNRLYAEAKKLNKTLITSKDAEEFLAEEFAQYKLDRKPIPGAPNRSILFKKLYDIIEKIRQILNLPPRTIEDLYKRLDKGYYKSARVQSQTEFKTLDRIGRLSVRKTKDLLDYMTGAFLHTLFQNDLSIEDIPTKQSALINNLKKRIQKQYDKWFELYQQDPTDADWADKVGTFKYVLDNWDLVTKEWLKKVNMLDFSKTIKDEYTKEEKAEASTEELDLEAEDNVTRDEALNYGIEANEVSAFSTTSLSTKLLIQSMLDMNEDGTLKLNSLGLPYIVNFKQTYNYLLNNLAGLTTPEQILEGLANIAKERPVYQQLADKLGTIKNASYQQLQQILQFRQDFAKNKFSSYATRIEKPGKIYSINLTQQTAANIIKDNWKAQAKYLSTLDENGKFKLDKSTLDAIASHSLNTAELLDKIGISLSPEALAELKEDYSLYSNALGGIEQALLQNGGDIVSLYSETSDNKTDINKFISLALRHTKDVTDLSFLSATKKSVYPIGYHNGLSIITSAINTAKTFDELCVKLPHLKSVTAENSYWLSSIFNKDESGKLTTKKEGYTIKLDIKDGMISGTDVNKLELPTKELSQGDKYVQEINDILLHGRSAYLRASDKSTEHAFTVVDNKGNTVTTISPQSIDSGMSIDKLKKIFSGYFKDEITRIALYKIKKTGTDIDKYIKNGGNFTIFEGMLSDKFKKDVLSQIDALVPEHGGTLLSIEDVKDLVEPLITEELEADLHEQVLGKDGYFDKLAQQIQADLKEFGVELGNGITEEDEIVKDRNNNKFSIETLTRAVALNDMISSIEQTKLYLGDLGFYSDLFKRTSSLTGTKETCANSDALNDWMNRFFNDRADNKKEDGTVRVSILADILGKIAKEKLEAYIKALIDHGYSLEEATDLLNKYTNYEESDAQGYIKLEALRSMLLRLGQLSHTELLILNKAIAGSLLSKDECDIIMLTVKKAQYAGPQEFEGIHAPAFHKYSLLPLIPQMVKGTNLETMLNQMNDKANPIDYVVYASGSKVGSKLKADGKFNEFYTENNQGEVSENIHQAVQTIYYDFLGIQTKTSNPKEKVTFGTQFRKLLFSGIFANGQILPGFKDVASDIAAFDKAIDQMVQEGKTKLIKDLNLSPKGTMQDIKAVVDLLRAEVESRDLSDNILNSIDVAVRDGELALKYKLDATVIKSKLDSLVTSLVNSRLIKQHINGDALIQAASTGFEAKGKRTLQSGLKFYTKEQPWMEVHVALNDNYKHLELKYKNVDGINAALAKGDILPEELTLIGYRIPTQGLNSMEHMHIAKFLPREASTTIVLPSEIVVKSGGDFDVDKLNIFRPEFNKDGSLADTATNKIIDISKKILTHPDNFATLITPNSTHLLKETADELKFIEHLNATGKVYDNLEEFAKDKEAFLNKKDKSFTKLLELPTKIKEFYKYMLAKSMVGMSAVHNTHHVLAQRTDLRMYREYGKLIPKHIVINLPHHGTETQISLSHATDVEGKRNIGEVISQVINATVDAVKDPFMFNLGMNSNTLSSYMFLLRTGVPSDTIAYFLNQPIIKEYLKEHALNESAFRKFNKLDKDSVVNKVLEKYIQNNPAYMKANGADQLATIKEEQFTREDLYKNLFKENQKLDDLEYIRSQRQALNDFLHYQNAARLLGNAMKATNMDTNGVGRSLESIRNKQESISNIHRSGLFNQGFRKILDDTIIKSFNQLDFTLDVFKPLYFIQNNEFIAGEIQEIINAYTFNVGEDKKQKFTELINNDFINFAIQNYGYSEALEDTRKRLFFGTTTEKSLANRILEIKRTKDKSTEALRQNLIIENLFPMLNKGEEGVTDNIKMFTRRLDKLTADTLTESFEDLFRIAPDLAKDIADAGILQSGLNNSPITFLSLIPAHYYGELANKAFNALEKSENFKTEVAKFQQLFVRNNAKDRLIYKAFKYYSEKGLGELSNPKHNMYGKDYSTVNYDKVVIPETEQPTTQTQNTQPDNKSTTEEPKKSGPKSIPADILAQLEMGSDEDEEYNDGSEDDDSDLSDEEYLASAPSKKQPFSSSAKVLNEIAVMAKKGDKESPLTFSRKNLIIGFKNQREREGSSLLIKIRKAFPNVKFVPIKGKFFTFKIEIPKDDIAEYKKGIADNVEIVNGGTEFLYEGKRYPIEESEKYLGYSLGNKAEKFSSRELLDSEKEVLIRNADAAKEGLKNLLDTGIYTQEEYDRDVRAVDEELKRDLEVKLPLDSLVNKYFGENEKTTPSELLDKVLANSDKNSLVYKIGTLLKANLSKNKTLQAVLQRKSTIQIHDSESLAGALFRPSINRAYFYKDMIAMSSEEKLQRDIIHEFMHSFTIYPFTKTFAERTVEERAFTKAITELYNDSKRLFGIEKYNEDTDPYGFKNVLEFVSEISSNQEFREALYNKNRTFFQKLVDAIKKLFGIALDDLGSKAEKVISDYVNFLDIVDTTIGSVKIKDLANKAESNRKNDEFSVKSKATVNKEKSWQELRDLNTVYIQDHGVVVQRVPDAGYKQFDNPFTASGIKGYVSVESAEKAANDYKAWLKGEDHENVRPAQRNWILNQIAKGRLDNKTLYYANDTGKGYTYVDALQELINDKTWLDLESLKKEEAVDERTSLPADPFAKQSGLFIRRINSLKKKLQAMDSGDPEFPKAVAKLEELEHKFGVARASGEANDYHELGLETINEIKGLTEDFKNGGEITTANAKYIIDALNALKEFSSLAQEAANAYNEVFPLIQKKVLDIVQENSPKQVTQDDIDAQSRDKGVATTYLGALADSANYYARTIGLLIKERQNKADIASKQLAERIKEEVKLLGDWAKKNGVKPEHMFDVFISSNGRTTEIVSMFNNDGTDNANYIKIQSTPELARFYNFYIDEMEKLQVLSPQQMGGHFIANVKAKGRIAFNKLVQVERNSNGVLSTEAGKDMFPLEFLTPLHESEKSRDLSSSLLQFGQFINNHHEMVELLPEVRMIEECMKKAVGKDGHIVNRQYYKNDTPNKAPVSYEDSNLHKIVDGYIRMQIFGDLKKKEGKFELPFKTDVVDDNGNLVGKRVVYTSDLLDGFLKYNSLLRIGFSPIGAINNVVFGQMGNFIEAVGGKFMNYEGLRASRNIFFRQTADKESTLNKLLEELNVLQELEDYHLVEHVSGNPKKLDFDKLQEFLYLPQKLGEKYLQSSTMLAVLIKEGMLTKSGELTDKYNNLTEKEKSQLTNKIQKLNYTIHGRYTSKEAAIAYQSVLFRLASQFKKWISTAVESRMLKEHEDVRLGETMKGRYRSLGEGIKAIATGNWDSLSNIDKYNMRKNIAEGLIIGALFGIMQVLKHGSSYDDKKRKKMWQVKLAMTLLDRAAGDAIFFYNPQSAIDMAGKAAPSVTTLNTMKQGFGYLLTAYGDNAKFKSGSRKGRYKIESAALRLTPGLAFIDQFHRILNDQLMEEFR